MCSVCEKVKGMDVTSALNEVSRATAKRSMSPHLSALVDRILGTSAEAEVDHDAEQAAFDGMNSLIAQTTEE